MTAAHEQRETLHVDRIYPAHDDRTESAEFRINKHRLVRKMDLGCWICGIKEKREVHHWTEWSWWNKVDPEADLSLLHVIDAYGFTADDPTMPMTSPDDIRNLVVLCEKHHRHPYFGVHMVDFPTWIAQKVVKPGEEVTRDPGGRTAEAAAKKAA
jgi:hypothetical protein